MSTTQAGAAKVARDYFDAWSAKDMDRTVSYAAHTIVCDAPAGRVEGHAQFRQLWDGFTRTLVAADLIAVYGDDNNAVLVYDIETVPVKSLPVAEYLTVRDGKIASIRMIFDSMPFVRARSDAETPATTAGQG